MEVSKGTNLMTMMITRGNRDPKAMVMPAMDFMKSFLDPVDLVVVPLVVERTKILCFCRSCTLYIK